LAANQRSLIVFRPYQPLLAFATLWLGASVLAGDMKVVGTTLLSLQYPFLISLDIDAGKMEGDYLINKLPNGGSVVYLVGEYAGSSTERRRAGFE
jgi:ABC-type sugar transport system substrate-binding protein